MSDKDKPLSEVIEEIREASKGVEFPSFEQQMIDRYGSIEEYEAACND